MRSAMAKDISIDISVTNIGPHGSLSYKSALGSLEMGVYANNGTGKTFLSRIFRVATKQEQNSIDSNKLISIGKTEGKFSLTITSSKEPGVTRLLTIELKRDVPPVVTNSTQYIFRVFNDDYVKENLEALKYKPNGQIEGYILSKQKIDLTKEKKKLEELKVEIQNVKDSVFAAGKLATNELDKLEISKNTSEYKQLTFNNLISPEGVQQEPEAFSFLLTKYNQFKSIPDNLEDVTLQSISSDPNSLNQDVKQFLFTPFTKSTLAEEFKNKVKAKQDFIEKGVELHKKISDQCPFCEQSLSEDAAELIDRYNQFLDDAEAKQIKVADSLIKQVQDLQLAIRETASGVLRSNEQLRKSKLFIPSLNEATVSPTEDPSNLDASFELIIETLTQKKGDISSELNSVEISTAFQKIGAWLISSRNIVAANNVVILLFNERKSNLNAERIELNRRLCRAKFWELKSAQDAALKMFVELRDKEALLIEEIAKKEQSEKVSRKEKVVETFKELLNSFFGEKYAFDENTFCLKFQNVLLESTAMDVLSTGERSIVAFCYFIAETHSVIEKETDYQNLFFVIDDPISSQDFHFVYATSQKIRNLHKYFGITRLRIVLLTHNLEFMSILIRNRVIDQKFILSDGGLTVIGNELIMPYEHHLRDIAGIVKDGKKAVHTTSNSLRHILETLNKFVAPDVELEAYCEGIDGFKENEFLYTMIHDQSHGGIRIQKAYTEEMIKKGCEVVINHIAKDYGGQLKKIAVS